MSTVKKLASIKFTFFLLLCLMALMGLGVGLTYGEWHAGAIRSISDTLPMSWLFSSGHDNRVVLAWFLATCLVAAVLFVNIVACIGLRLADLRRNAENLRRNLFVLVHAMFAVVLICHGLGMIFGFKYSAIELWSGETYSFGADYEILVDEIIFKDDMAMLEADYKTRRSMMTRKRFHPEDNFATVTLKQGGRVIQSGRIHILAPMVVDGIQITMTGFIHDKNQGENPVGVSLSVTKNPVTPLFFISYTFLILSLSGLVIVTWRPGTNGRVY
jgi:hypothetical protein